MKFMSVGLRKLVRHDDYLGEKMAWNYRIGVTSIEVKTVNDVTYKGTGEFHSEKHFGIYEVYYDEDGNIMFTTENPVEPCGETKEELIECLEMMLSDAKEHEVLDLDVLWEDLKKNSKWMMKMHW